MIVKMIFRVLLLASLITTASCATPSAKSPGELRSLADRSFGYNKEVLKVDASFPDVVKRMEMLSEECLSVQITSKHLHRKYYSRLHAGADKAALTLQKQDTEGLLVVTTSPEEAGYVMVIDAERSGRQSAKITVHTPKRGFERLKGSVTGLLLGQLRGCPGPDLFP